MTQKQKMYGDEEVRQVQEAVLPLFFGLPHAVEWILDQH